MATMIDLKKSINKVLESNFPNVELYSSDAKEGFNEPCFFTQIVSLNSENETVNYTSNKVMVAVNYFCENRTELENLKMDVDLREAFGMNLKVNQRSFLIQNISSSIVDEILQLRFNLDYLVSSDRNKNLGEEEYELMKEIDLDLKRRDD